MWLLSILWVLILLVVLYRKTPDAGYPRELEQRVLYYSVWLIMAGLMVYIHYQLMANAGHGHLAAQLDESTAGLFVALRLLRFWIKRLSHSVSRFDLRKLPRGSHENGNAPAFGALKHHDCN